tara:strand:+ start:621 stop:1232 length:612 start_codon:yes stop_codon:yes gene_type:complete
MFDKKLLLQHIKNQDINTENLSEQKNEVIPWNQDLMDKISGKGKMGENDPLYKGSKTPEEAAEKETTNRPSFLGRAKPWEGRGVTEDEYNQAVAAKKLHTAKFWDKFYKERRGIKRDGADERANLNPVDFAPEFDKGRYKKYGTKSSTGTASTGGFSTKNLTNQSSVGENGSNLAGPTTSSKSTKIGSLRIPTNLLKTKPGMS